MLPISHRKSVQFGLLVAALAIASVLMFFYSMLHTTERQQAAEHAVRQAESHADVVRYLGSPVRAHGDISGQVKTEERRPCTPLQLRR